MSVAVDDLLVGSVITGSILLGLTGYSVGILKSKPCTDPSCVDTGRCITCLQNRQMKYRYMRGGAGIGLAVGAVAGIAGIIYYNTNKLCFCKFY